MKTREKGITLIALVITIIVLLILAGVAIATLSGENGLFARAKQAKQTQTESEMKEKLNLSIQELQVEKLTEATLDDITQEWLTQKLSEYNPILKENETAEGKKVTLQKDGVIKSYFIDINLNITEIVNENNIEFSYEIKSRNNGTIQILIKVKDSENGIDKIECSNGNIIECFGTKQEKSIDYTIGVGTEYIYKVISTDTTEVKLETGKQNISFFIDAYSSEIIVSCIGKSLDNDFIEHNLDLLKESNYKLEDVVLHSDRGGMYKSGIYNTKTADMNLIPSMSAPYTCTHNPWIETINGQFKDFIKNNYPKNLDELQIALNKFVYYNNNIKIKKKLKTTAINYRCSHS